VDQGLTTPRIQQRLMYTPLYLYWESGNFHPDREWRRTLRPPAPPAPPPSLGTCAVCGRAGRSGHTPVLASEGLLVGALGQRPRLGWINNPREGWCDSANISNQAILSSYVDFCCYMPYAIFLLLLPCVVYIKHFEFYLQHKYVLMSLHIFSLVFVCRCVCVYVRHA